VGVRFNRDSPDVPEFDAHGTDFRGFPEGSASARICTARNLVERFFNKISSVGEWQPAATSQRSTTSPSFSLRQSGYGCALMSPRRDLITL
jgi:hypothetical protein